MDICTWKGEEKLKNRTNLDLAESKVGKYGTGTLQD